MSSTEEMREIIKKFGNSSSNINFLHLLDVLSKDEDVIISIPVSGKPKKDNFIKKRVEVLEKNMSELKRNFELFLKTEFKEESNRVLINMMKDIKEIKYIHMKIRGNNIRYYIIDDSKDYMSYLENVIDVELKIEESYSMLEFEFIHKNIKDLDYVNLEGTYLVYSSEG
ncbi:MAG: hypothetical protein ACTSWE_03950 [Promethearchaeota archaeon]